MKSFELYDATTVEEAVGLLDQHGPTSKVVAGGTDLVTVMRNCFRTTRTGTIWCCSTSTFTVTTALASVPVTRRAGPAW